MASEKDPAKSLQIIANNLRPHQIIYIGAIDVLDAEIESAHTVCDRGLAAAKYIPVQQLGTTNDYGFAPFSDDIGKSRDIASAKIKVAVKEPTILAQKQLIKTSSQ